MGRRGSADRAKMAPEEAGKSVIEQSGHGEASGDNWKRRKRPPEGETYLSTTDNGEEEEEKA